MKKRVATVAIASVGILALSVTPLSNPIKHHPKPLQLKATMVEKRHNKKMAQRYAWVGYGWKGREWKCINYIFTKESRYDHLAKNQQGSSAFGIAQRLGEKSKDPAIQILGGYKYIKKRYGTPCRAMHYHVRRGHY